MEKKKLNKTTKSNLITYGMVLAAYLIVQGMIAGNLLSNLMQGLLVPLCVYIILALSLNLTVGILGELSLGHAGFMCIGRKPDAHHQGRHGGNVGRGVLSGVEPGTSIR